MHQKMMEKKYDEIYKNIRRGNYGVYDYFRPRAMQIL